MKSILLLLAQILVFSLYAQDTLFYTVILSGNKAGIQKIWQPAANTYEIFYEYNDRGRGPLMQTTLKTDDQFFLTYLDGKGNDYLKTPVTEHFEIANGKATWKNQMEDEAKTLTGKAFYSSINGVPFEQALLVKALLKSANQSIEMLPDGKSTIRKVLEKEVTQNGQTEKLTLYAIKGTGVGLTPGYIWLDDKQNHFGSAFGWFGVVKQGWEAVLADLYNIQLGEDEKIIQSFAKTQTTLPTTPVLIKNVQLFDSEKAKLLPDMAVLYENGIITAVGKLHKIKAPQNAQVIDGKGQTLLPGLWDMHVHVGDEDGIYHLAAGVTSVRDLANNPYELPQRKQKFDNGELVGPRIFMAGFIDAKGPYAGPIQPEFLASSEEEAIQIVDKYAKIGGYEQIKIYSSIKPSWVPAIAKQAKKYGMRVSGHIPAFMIAENAVRAGYDEIQHTNFLVLNFLSDTLDTRTPLRFTAVAQNAASLDMLSERGKNFVKLLKQHKTVLDPTVAIFEEMFTGRAGQFDPVYLPIAQRLPLESQRSLKGGGLPVPDGMDETYRKSFQKMLDIVALMHKEGIQIVAGTDAWAGFALHRELELYVKAGIPANEVLKIATYDAAKVMKRDKELGSITKGKKADMILVNGNPIQNINDIRNVTLTIKDGKMFDPAKLYEGIGIKPATTAR